MLSREQISFFKNQGYLVLEGLVHQDKYLNPIRKEYSGLLDSLIDKWVAQGKIEALPLKYNFFEKLLASYLAGCDWFQPMDISLPGDKITNETPMHFSEATFKLLTCPSILDAVEQLIGPEITSNPIQHVRLKPPTLHLHESEVRAHVSKTDWHQDKGVALPEADQTNMITVWIAVTDATEENGCLVVIPKNKCESELFPHCQKEQTAIDSRFIEYSSVMPLPVKSGGIVLLDPLTPHASLNNGSSDFRWSFDIRYNVTGQPTGRSHFPSFIARSRKDPGIVLTDWTEWKSMWEQARDRLATAKHIPIHRWKSDSPFCA